MENEKALIIMVDDNQANLNACQDVLIEKYHVSTASSAEKLFSFLETNRPALILLDINMPDMDGYEVIKILKSKPETADIPVIFIAAKTEVDNELEGLSLGAVDYIIRPIQPALLIKRIEVHLLVDEQRRILEHQAVELKQFNDNLLNMVLEKSEDIIEMQNAQLKTMAEIVEYRDDITGKHIERTQTGIRILIEELKANGIYLDEISGWNVDVIIQSCQLHDIGKLFINDSILRKPGKLSLEETEDMKIHTHIGKQIVEKVEMVTKTNDFLKYAKIIIACHHEKWDGTGYPNQLKGTDIPLLGRIMAIIDVYDVLVSIRPYKKAYTHAEALEIIGKEKEKHFDPVIVDCFIKASDRFKGI